MSKNLQWKLKIFNETFLASLVLFEIKHLIFIQPNLVFLAQNLSNLKENHLSSMHPTKSQCYSPVENIKILALKIARFVVFERTTLVLKCSSLQQLPKKQVILHVVLSTYKLFGHNTNKKQKQYFKTISFVRVSSYYHQINFFR